jgi:protein gp37
MGAETKIQWCHHTFNPWVGCTRVSPGCVHCYAEAQNVRWRGGVNWGPGAERRVTSASNWREPLKWNREAEAAGERRRVFCASLADWADAEAPEGALPWLWELIRACSWLDFLMLTKRTHRIRECLPPDWGDGYANVWLGTTVEDQSRADERIPRLLEVPARVRFLSMEPMLGPVDLDLMALDGPRLLARWSQLHWIIVGGESGPGARPFYIDWARDIVRQCRGAGVAPFVKQFGANPRMTDTQNGATVDFRIALTLDRAHGGDPREWPEDLRVREFPKETR